MITSITNLLLFLGFTTKRMFVRRLVYLDIEKSLLTERKPLTLNKWLFSGFCGFLYCRYRRSIKIADLTELRVAGLEEVGAQTYRVFWDIPWKIENRLKIVRKAIEITNYKY